MRSKFYHITSGILLTIFIVGMFYLKLNSPSFVSKNNEFISLLGNLVTIFSMYLLIATNIIDPNKTDAINIKLFDSLILELNKILQGKKKMPTIQEIFKF